MMKQYIIDEIRIYDYEKIKNHLDARLGPAELDNIYWLPLGPSLHTDIQAAHRECHPLYFALELNTDSIAAEFLVRTKNRVRCDCIGNATQAQAAWLIEFVDSVFEKLEIPC